MKLFTDTLTNYKQRKKNIVKLSINQTDPIKTLKNIQIPTKMKNKYQPTAYK